MRMRMLAAVFAIVLLAGCSRYGLQKSTSITHDYRESVERGDFMPELVQRGDLMWTVRDNGSDLDWNEARAYCEACRVGAYSDWRMPTLEELEGLYDVTQSYNLQGRFAQGGAWSFDVHIANPFRITAPWVWSSTRDDSSSAFHFFYYYGRRGSRNLSNRYNVRVLCVRRSGN